MPGAGRKSLFPGDRMQTGYKLTTYAVALIRAERERLETALVNDGKSRFLATEAAAAESLIRKGAEQIEPLREHELRKAQGR